MITKAPTLEDLERQQWDALRSRGLTGARVLPKNAPVSIRESDRSFLCVATSEAPTPMRDWATYTLVDEILLAKGGKIPGDHVPLLRNHYRNDPADDIYGSAREWNLENEIQWACRCFMSEPSDERDPVIRAWTRILGGHLRRVSIGYEVLGFEDIQPGEKKKVAGRFFTAGARVLRVSTEWTIHELSLTPIGADPNALIRSKGGDPPPVITGFRKSLPDTFRSYFR
jgi:hypothetical protein